MMGNYWQMSLNLPLSGHYANLAWSLFKLVRDEREVEEGQSGRRERGRGRGRRRRDTNKFPASQVRLSSTTLLPGELHHV